MLEFFNLYILEPDFVAMILQKNAAITIAKVLPILVLTIGHECVPFLSIALIFEHLHSIQPMFNMIALHNNCSCVPSCDVERLLFRSRNEVVERGKFAISLHSKLCIRMAKVVENLEFATDSTTLALVHIWVDEVLYATIGTFGNLEIDLKNEVVIGFICYDIATITAFCAIRSLNFEDSILYSPTLCGKGLQLCSAPTISGFAVPKELPAFSLFLF